VDHVDHTEILDIGSWISVGDVLLAVLTLLHVFGLLRFLHRAGLNIVLAGEDALRARSRF